MSARFQELDWRPTPMGAISLRRRRDPSFGVDVYEIKLDDDFLMSSLFTTGETALAELGLAELTGTDLDVVVGGLGLGYTAARTLEDARVRRLFVIESFAEVIEWHERGLVPAGPQLTADPRCSFVHGDFFALATSPEAFDPDEPGRRFHGVIVDIDHSPRHLLSAAHAAFYQTAGLRSLADHLHPGGVFALWSNEPPDEDFRSRLAEVFADARAHVVEFDNPLQGRTAANTVYVART